MRFGLALSVGKSVRGVWAVLIRSGIFPRGQGPRKNNWWCWLTISQQFLDISTGPTKLTWYLLHSGPMSFNDSAFRVLGPLNFDIESDAFRMCALFFAILRWLCTRRLRLTKCASPVLRDSHHRCSICSSRSMPRCSPPGPRLPFDTCLPIVYIRQITSSLFPTYLISLSLIKTRLNGTANTWEGICDEAKYIEWEEIGLAHLSHQLVMQQA